MEHNARFLYFVCLGVLRTLLFPLPYLLIILLFFPNLKNKAVTCIKEKYQMKSHMYFLTKMNHWHCTFLNVESFLIHRPKTIQRYTQKTVCSHLHPVLIADVFFTNADLLFNLFSEEGILDTALDSCIHCSHTLVLKAVYILVCAIICHKFENVPLGQY